MQGHLPNAGPWMKVGPGRGFRDQSGDNVQRILRTQSTCPRPIKREAPALGSSDPEEEDQGLRLLPGQRACGRYRDELRMLLAEGRDLPPAARFHWVARSETWPPQAASASSFLATSYSRGAQLRKWSSPSHRVTNGNLDAVQSLLEQLEARGGR